MSDLSMMGMTGYDPDAFWERVCAQCAALPGSPPPEEAALRAAVRAAEGKVYGLKTRPYRNDPAASTAVEAAEEEERRADQALRDLLAYQRNQAGK